MHPLEATIIYQANQLREAAEENARLRQALAATPPEAPVQDAAEAEPAKVPPA